VSQTIHTWEKQELRFTLQGRYANPYTDVKVWVELEGPGFRRRCYGFWDGGDEYIVRVTATAPGAWSWRAGSDTDDPGLMGQEGSFEAIDWSTAERAANRCRRGFLRPTQNGHAFMHADGTPCFLLGDTWWAAGTFRFPMADTDTPETPRSLPHYVAQRAHQGFNCIFIIAALPNWVDDGLPATLDTDEGMVVRRAWPQTDTRHAKPMHDEDGNLPFQFPGRVPGFEQSVPDLDRINPAYFRSLDRKIDYLNAHGFIPFIEPARRDIGQVWAKHHDWPSSYARYVQYIWSRYQANNCLLSPIHYDLGAFSVPAPMWSQAANAVVDTYGMPPFGTPVGANSDGSSLLNFGHTDAAPWLDFHQTGNARRDHYSYAQLTDAFNSNPPVPVLNGEPQYEGMRFRQVPGWYYGETKLGVAPSEEAARHVRSAAYGSVLSGGLAGHIYGAGGWDGGIWRGDVEEASPVPIWDAMQWPGAAQMQHMTCFLQHAGDRYVELVPSLQLVDPNRSGPVTGFDGWAYCAATPARDLLLIYLEHGTPTASVTQLPPETDYQGRWFDPRTGEWSDPWQRSTDATGKLALPDKPTVSDWALDLTS
jgi:hypothetical protein